MSDDKNKILYFDQSIPSAKWTDSAGNCGSLPDDVARFRANLVMFDLPQKEIGEAVDAVRQDGRRWEGIGSPYFVSPMQIDSFHAYLVECDPDLDLTQTCPDARRRLTRTIITRRRWADLASRSCSDGEYSQAFKHYDEALDALWPAPGSAGFRDFIEASSLAFRQQMMDNQMPLGRGGLGIQAYHSDKRDYRSQSSLEALDDSLSNLGTKLVLACQAEASIFKIEMEAVFFTIGFGDSAASLNLLGYFSDLWRSHGMPRLKDVEAFVAYGLAKRWRGPAFPGKRVPHFIERESRTIRRFCEALMARTIRPITGFARELAAYHPLFEEDGYYEDAEAYHDYLNAVGARFANDRPDDVVDA
jgi:hypothetical protein